ncbi:hypothetical protein GSI_10004 [Ganoderma sinense ZZ0214-1]|uniref:Uncharacterized protein n=1 Tax=Ganoderma sinense ZZ0214-1 TaxID=1077348 RepID=A0A2G8S299_9APHY|nr:hypothetical protein GSI_10004 [Ganoderma sinense ZZ0214-1]
MLLDVCQLRFLTKKASPLSLSDSSASRYLLHPPTSEHISKLPRFSMAIFGIRETAGSKTEYDGAKNQKLKTQKPLLILLKLLTIPGRF